MSLVQLRLSGLYRKGRKRETAFLLQAAFGQGRAGFGGMATQ
jgi:hypothetical protein